MTLNLHITILTLHQQTKWSTILIYEYTLD